MNSAGHANSQSFGKRSTLILRQLKVGSETQDLKVVLTRYWIVLRTRYLPQHASPLDDFRFIFSASIASCFRRISLSQLSRWLDIPSDKVGEWCSKVEWTVEGQDAVIPNNGQNDVKAGVVKENVQLGREYPGLERKRFMLTKGRIDQVGGCGGLLDGFESILEFDGIWIMHASITCFGRG